MRLLSYTRLTLALGLATNGLAMLAWPAGWYLAVPGVPATGPLNLHFVRDIGCAFLVCGFAFFWLAYRPAAWPAAMAGTLFLLMHAGVHLGDAACGVTAPSALLRDLPGVFLVPLAALCLAWPRRFSSSEKENFDARMDSKVEREAAARGL
jgi:hypothetical protein